MLNSRQRAYLRKLAQPLEPILYIGYSGVTEQVAKQADDALAARELIKCSVQKTQDMTTREVMDELAETIHADEVQCIGRRFALYRMAREPDKRKIVLPK